MPKCFSLGEWCLLWGYFSLSFNIAIIRFRSGRKSENVLILVLILLLLLLTRSFISFVDSCCTCCLQPDYLKGEK